ncbi:DUF4232 domain-containing protein [Streptomyces sp. NBC_00400]|uniref:DUF4232 domain-containing protein n=1 Tax=Streptomyces sp. NBC_00400 TaxID=2975737 RepID=UPI003FA79F8E
MSANTTARTARRRPLRVAAESGSAGSGVERSHTSGLKASFARGEDATPDPKAGGSTTTSVVVTNKGSRTCRIGGFPGVDLKSENGGERWSLARQARLDHPRGGLRMGDGARCGGLGGDQPRKPAPSDARQCGACRVGTMWSLPHAGAATEHRDRQRRPSSAALMPAEVGLPAAHTTVGWMWIAPATAAGRVCGRPTGRRMRIFFRAGMNLWDRARFLARYAARVPLPPPGVPTRTIRISGGTLRSCAAEAGSRSASRSPGPHSR